MSISAFKSDRGWFGIRLLLFVLAAIMLSAVCGLRAEARQYFGTDNPSSTNRTNSPTKAALHVGPGGKDHNPCTAAAPCRQIRRALQLAKPGTTILVADGNYSGFDISDLHGTASAPIVVRAEGTNTVVTGSGDRGDNRDNIYIAFSDFIVIDGLRSFKAPRAGLRVDQSHHVTIRNGVFGDNGTWGIFTNHSNDLLLENNETYGSKTQHGIYVSNSGDRPVVRRNRSHDNARCGIQLNGDLSSGGGRGVVGDGIISDGVIEENIIYNNGRPGGGAGINLDGVQNTMIRNNLIYLEHASGITMYQGDGGAGPVGNQVLNNTIDMAADAGGRPALLVYKAVGTNTVRNNILNVRAAKGWAIEFESASDAARTDTDYNVFGDVAKEHAVTSDAARIFDNLGAWQAVKRTLPHDQNSRAASDAELFVNPAAGDYRLKPNSPALDAGIALPGTVNQR